LVGEWLFSEKSSGPSDGGPTRKQKKKTWRVPMKSIFEKPTTFSLGTLERLLNRPVVALDLLGDYMGGHPRKDGKNQTLSKSKLLVRGSGKWGGKSEKKRERSVVSRIFQSQKGTSTDHQDQGQLFFQKTGLVEKVGKGSNKVAAPNQGGTTKKYRG